jgi:hypothetical protein
MVQSRACVKFREGRTDLEGVVEDEYNDAVCVCGMR